MERKKVDIAAKFHRLRALHRALTAWRAAAAEAVALSAQRKREEEERRVYEADMERIKQVGECWLVTSRHQKCGSPCRTNTVHGHPLVSSEILTVFWFAIWFHR